MESRIPAYVLGSPPLTRGTLSSQSLPAKWRRITPAYAGNTHCDVLIKKKQGDHPRLRGEHKEATHAYVKAEGSPPLTRGTLCIFSEQHYYTRITPAYAGNTIKAFSKLETTWDHPRLRGEHRAV